MMTVVGTRPEIIRLSAVLNKLEQSNAIEHTLVHTGQNYDYELNEVFFKDFNFLMNFILTPFKDFKNYSFYFSNGSSP